MRDLEGDHIDQPFRRCVRCGVGRPLKSLKVSVGQPCNRICERRDHCNALLVTTLAQNSRRNSHAVQPSSTGAAR